MKAEVLKTETKTLCFKIKTKTLKIVFKCLKTKTDEQLLIKSSISDILCVSTE